MKRELIFQAFNWQISGIIDNLENIVNQGFTIIQVSPMQQHKESENPTWYLAYQPTNYKIGNRLGSKSELTELCSKANELGIMIIVDVVFNHVANDGGGNKQLVPSIEVDPEIRTNSKFFHDPCMVKNYEDRFQYTQYGIGLPDLNTANHELQLMHIKYLIELLECGVKGFRFDAIKHIELPDDDVSYASDYWTNVLDCIPNKDELFIYGECIYAPDDLIRRYSKYMKVGINTNSTVDENKLVRWSISHDDDLTFNTGNKNPEVLINEWEHVLAYYPDTHMLFYPAANDDTWKNERIKYLNNKHN